MATAQTAATLAAITAFAGAVGTIPIQKEFHTTATPNRKQRRTAEQRNKRKQQKASRRRNRG